MKFYRYSGSFVVRAVAASEILSLVICAPSFSQTIRYSIPNSERLLAVPSIMNSNTNMNAKDKQEVALKAANLACRFYGFDHVVSSTVNTKEAEHPTTLMETQVRKVESFKTKDGSTYPEMKLVSQVPISDSSSMHALHKPWSYQYQGGSSLAGVGVLVAITGGIALAFEVATYMGMNIVGDDDTATIVKALKYTGIGTGGTVCGTLGGIAWDLYRPRTKPHAGQYGKNAPDPKFQPSDTGDDSAPFVPHLQFSNPIECEGTLEKIQNQAWYKEASLVDVPHHARRVANFDRWPFSKKQEDIPADVKKSAEDIIVQKAKGGIVATSNEEIETIRKKQLSEKSKNLSITERISLCLGGTVSDSEIKQCVGNGFGRLLSTRKATDPKKVLPGLTFVDDAAASAEVDGALSAGKSGNGSAGSSARPSRFFGRRSAQVHQLQDGAMDAPYSVVPQEFVIDIRDKAGQMHHLNIDSSAMPSKLTEIHVEPGVTVVRVHPAHNE
jgi:hypothetical protein